MKKVHFTAFLHGIRYYCRDIQVLGSWVRVSICAVVLANSDQAGEKQDHHTGKDSPCDDSCMASTT